MFRRWLILSLFLTAVGLRALAENSFVIEPAVSPPPGIPAALLNMLQSSGTRLLKQVNGLRTPVCEVWWRKTIPVQRAGKSRKQAYGQIAEGTLIGILYVTNRRRDFGEHYFGPGLYTVRYAGAHPEKRGTDADDDKQNDALKHAYHDFVVLSDINSDQRFNARLRYSDLSKLSRRVSPAAAGATVFALVPVDRAYKEFPTAVADDQGNCALQFRTGTVARGGRAGQMDLGILLVTPPNVSAED
jgi:hypothetical protein